MNSCFTRQFILGFVLILSLGFACLAQTTEFTYQGYLNDNSQAASGDYDFEFALFDALEGGAQIGGTLTRTGIPVSNGKFTVRLDFGAEFPGANRYLEIGVRQSATPAAKNEAVAAFTSLSPRQPVTSAPYSVKSLYASNAATADNATNATNAVNADNATTAINAANADNATNATNATNADHATTADHSTTSDNATNAANADNATNATNATNADNATTASNALQLGGINANQFVLTTDPRMADARPPMGGSAWYVQNRTSQQSSSNFNVSGTGKANIFDAVTHYSIGGFRILGNPGSHNLFAGRLAGDSNTTGFSNSFFGDSTGYLNNTGSYNSFFGERAGFRNTGGSSNSFFGTSAGNSNTTGNSNSFFGWRSGYWNNNGDSNSFFGEATGFHNTTGFDNSFFGKGAGENNKTIGANVGSYNTFIGRDAGNKNTTGFRNTVVGAYAFDSNETGRDNTVVGIYAGGNASGTDNAFLGRYSGYSTTGNYNTFLGSGTGGTNATGNYNTTLGGSSDVASGGLTFATAIGAGSKVSASATVQLGRDNFDTVRIGKLGAAGATSLCQNASKEISTCSSSIRYKSDIEDFRSGLDLIEQLRPVSFNWKQGGMTDIGLVAEEVEKIEPLLTTRKDGRVEGIKYDRLGVVLINTVKEQQGQIENQQEQINEQKKLNQSLLKQMTEQYEINKQHEAEIKTLKALVCSQNKDARICRQKENKQ